MTLVFKQPIQLDKDTQSDVKPSSVKCYVKMWRILSSPARDTPDTLSHLEKRPGASSCGQLSGFCLGDIPLAISCIVPLSELVEMALFSNATASLSSPADLKANFIAKNAIRVFITRVDLNDIFRVHHIRLLWMQWSGNAATDINDRDDEYAEQDFGVEDAADNDEYADKDFENLVKQFRVDEKMCYFHSQIRAVRPSWEHSTEVLPHLHGLLNMECSEEDIYTIAGYDFEWRVVGRRLLSDQRVRDIDCEGSSERDKRDKMLLEWKKAKSRDATYQALVKVLRAIENNATADRVEALEKSISQASTSNQSTTDGVVKLPKEKEVTCTLAMIHAQIEEVKKLKRSITIDQVGVLGDGERAKCIIVEGIPGIGKSTFSWHLGVCWTQKEILHDYHLVVLLRLRDERVQHAKCVSDLFYHYDQTTREAVVQWITSCEGDGVMMVLDGYDELSPDLQKSSIFANIIRGVVLPKMTVLVSSRPSANDNLHQLCQDQKCQYIEVIGFGKEEIQEYVDAALEQSKELRDQLMSYLEHHPHIHGLMYCPLNCAIIVQIFRDQMKSRSQPPQTLTEVYQVLIKTVLKRHEQKSVEPPAAMKHKGTSTIPNKPSTFPWLGDVSDQTIPQLLVLAKLAYDGTNEDQLIFHGPSGTMETLGLLQEVPELYLESSGSSSYHFLHKTVQEFMAALHVSSLPPGERAEFLRTSFGKSNITMVVRFMAGLTKFQSQDDIEGVLAFQEKVERGLLESLHWLFEARDPGLVQKCMGHREWTLQLEGENLDPFNCYVLGYCIANSRQPWNVSLPQCSINGQCVKMLMMVEKGRAFDYIKTIDFTFNHKLGDEGSIVLVSLVGSDGCITLAFVMSVVRLQRCSINSTNIIHGIPLNVMAVTELMVAQAASTPVHCWKILRGNKVLTSLQLQGCGIEPEGLSELCSALEVNTTLTELDLSQNKFDDHSLASLEKMLRGNKVLTSLELLGCGIEPEGLSELCSALEVNTTLTELNLSFNTFDGHSSTILGPEGLSELCSALQMNTTLTELDLSSNTFDVHSLASLGKMLRGNKVLTSLQLKNLGIHVGPEGLSELCSALEVNTTLTELDLSYNAFDDHSSASLVQLLTNNQTLEKLSLRWSGLDDDAICSLAKGLEHCQLKKLDLWINDFTMRGITELFHVLKNHPTLTKEMVTLPDGLKWS
eukprot:Em0001g2922a